MIALPVLPARAGGVLRVSRYAPGGHPSGAPGRCRALNAHPTRGGPAVRSRAHLASSALAAERALPEADSEAVRGSVSRAAAGDADAFGALYDRFAPELLRYFHARVRGDEAARDLVQQLFLKAWQAIPRYQERGLPFAAWLFRMAHNLVVDHHRARRAVAPIEGVERPSDDPHADMGLIAGERAAAVRRALGRLSDDHRHVLVLRFVLEKSARETGEIMGRREVTIRGLQHRALRALRSAIEANGDQL